MMENILAICLGIGLSACCGFRVFVPLLAANVASMLNLYHFSSGFEWMGTWTAFAIFATATVGEIAAYYIPVVDNLLDTIATPMAVAAGTLLTTSYLGHDMSPVLKWGTGLMVGGSAAGIVQAGTSLLRLGSTSTTGGLANPVVSTAENTASVVFSALTLWLPVVIAILAILFMFYLVKKLMAYFGKKKEADNEVIIS